MGIGAAAARKFAQLGAAVAVLDRDAEAGSRAVTELTDAGMRAEFFACDVSDTPEVEKAFSGIRKSFGGLDVLVSNAGIQRYGKSGDVTEEQFEEVLAVNLKGLFLCAKHAVALMRERGGGAIVAVGSVQSVAAIESSAAYVTSKHGLLGLARSLALDYAADNIRVNCVLPGSIDTPMLQWAVSLSADPEAVLEQLRHRHPLSRLGTPEEVANAIAFLASDWASFITGAALLVDGGLMLAAGGAARSRG
jgi:NAD(P)-dependent dehydrogenase (short-subunit alcohol dehydrogenase family)